MDFFSFSTLVPFIVAIVVIWTLFQVARVVPQRENFVVERLGKDFFGKLLNWRTGE